MTEWLTGQLLVQVGNIQRVNRLQKIEKHFTYCKPVKKRNSKLVTQSVLSLFKICMTGDVRHSIDISLTSRIPNINLWPLNLSTHALSNPGPDRARPVHCWLLQVCRNQINSTNRHDSQWVVLVYQHGNLPDRLVLYSGVVLLSHETVSLFVIRLLCTLYSTLYLMSSV